MFRLSIMILFTICSVSAVAQDPLNVVDGKGKRQGAWRKLDSADRVIYEGRFKDGIPAGEFRYFYPDGKLKTISYVSNQGKRAVTTSYFPNGHKMAAGIYINEKKDSTWQFFSESIGTIVSEESYQAGVVNGPSKVFYPDGKLSEMHYYKNGIKDGLWEQYYMDGKLKLRGAYKSGEKNGQFKILDLSGHPMVEGRYNHGHQDGVWIYYSDKGAIAKKETYKNGELLTTESPDK
ncbi:MAG: toxin-antitoxin system YwqK family antitoxin [Bacteroidales bacterium]|nr:toxin-antitoxin system YwqK family antitoxin [Bacteroidales bacterium]